MTPVDKVPDMTALDYGALPIPAELRTLHDRLAAHPARTGTWWSATERVAMVTEARRAADVGSGDVPDRYVSRDVLPLEICDLIHRIVLQPGQLSRTLYEDLLARGISEGAYVECVGLVAQLVGFDAFARTIGAGRADIAQPEAGEPTRTVPPGADHSRGAWVPMVSPREAVGDQRAAYDALVGGAPNILRALSLVPSEHLSMLEVGDTCYLTGDLLDLDTDDRPLTRPQIELIAARVSAVNECFY